jgi:prolyl oligopeptidase
LKKIIVLLVVGFLQTLTAQKQTPAPSVNVTDTYHGIEIVDEYRNLENLQDPAVISWMKSQTAYTDSIIKHISNREKFLEKAKALDSKSNFIYGSLKITIDHQYFYTKMKSNDTYRKLYYRKGFTGVEKLLYDPKDYKPENKKQYVISYYNPSHDGTKVAIALTEGGKEIAEIIIYDLVNNKVLPEIITHTWPSDLGGIKWLPDNTGFVFMHIPNIDSKSNDFIKNTQTVVYKIGTNPESIKDIFSKANNPEIKINSEDFPIIDAISNHTNYFFARIGGADNYNNGYYAMVNNVYQGKINWKPLFTKADKIDAFKIDGNTIIYTKQVNNSSSIYKTPLSSLDFINTKPFIALKKGEIIDEMGVTKEGLFFSTLENGVVARLYFYDRNKNKQINLPIAAGSISIQTLDQKLSDIWIACYGWTKQKTRYKYNVQKNTFTLEEIEEEESYPEFDNVVVEEVNVKTHDNQDMPLTIIYKKGLKKDSKNRVIMQGYGAYGISLNPYFNPYDLFWVNDGGVLAIAHIRGGGEKGETWHKGGYKQTKPNTWKDFISSAEYLIKEGYTDKEYLGIEGASAGGILIGRAITARPDLFKAAVIEVGMLNAIRNEKTPNGPNNAKEFGSSENKEEFKYLLEMDAYHQIKKGVKYPATLVTAGMNDPRVIAWMPSKFAAKLQASNTGDNPILLNVDPDSGHGMDATYDKQYQKLADSYAFFYWQLGHPDYKLTKK